MLEVTRPSSFKNLSTHIPLVSSKYRWCFLSLQSNLEIGNIVNIDMNMQPHLLNDMMQIFKMERISINDLGVEKYKILNW